VRPASELSKVEARWLALDAQGLSRPRPKGPVNRRHVRAAIAAPGMVQLDAINVVERTQFLVLFSRLGSYATSRLHDLTGPGGELFEYWGRMAALIPVHRQPLFRWRMAHGGAYGDSPKRAAWRRAWGETNAGYIAEVRNEVRDRGPLSASQLTDPRRQNGEWWDRRSVGRQALEWLFAGGDLAGWRTPNFERVYDLPERVIPTEVLAAPTPSVEEAHRRLLVLAARSLGVGTATDLRGYYLIRPAAARDRLAELVEAGELVEVSVEGWREPGYAPPDVRPKRPTREHATLLSPFDSLIWERSRTLRVFDFDYRIEVYVPEPKRRYGYFVLPLLVGDELVARLDLKADRKASALMVRGAFIEPGIAGAEVAATAAPELTAIQAWLGLERVEVGRRGNLSSAVRAALR
jgi:uncharacterized protein YcaQ